MWKKMQRNCILITSNFIIHPQILIFSVFFHILIADKIFHITLLLRNYFCDQFVHRKFVAADVTAVFVNNQHGIQ